MAIHTHTGRALVPQPVGRTVVGHPEHIANVLANHYRNGTLVSVSPLPQPSITDGRITVRMTVHTAGHPACTLTRLQTIAERKRSPRPGLGRLAIITIAVAAPIVGATVAAAYLIGALVQFITDNAATIIGGIVIAAIIVAALRGSGNGRRHCPGAFHR